MTIINQLRERSVREALTRLGTERETTHDRGFAVAAFLNESYGDETARRLLTGTVDASMIENATRTRTPEEQYEALPLFGGRR